jgi:hypothetical protein
VIRLLPDVRHSRLRTPHLTVGYHHGRAIDAVNIKCIAIIVAMAVLGTESPRPEQQEPKRVSVSPQPQPKLVIRADELFPLTPPKRLGMFTLVPPQRDGEILRVTIPVGELVSRTARAISDANHRRVERKADERVRKDLERFLAASPKGPTEP